MSTLQKLWEELLENDTLGEPGHTYKKIKRSSKRYERAWHCKSKYETKLRCKSNKRI